MSFEMHDDLKDLDDLDYDDDNDDDEEELLIDNNYNVKLSSNKKVNSDYLKDIDDLSDDEVEGDEQDDDMDMENDRDGDNDELLDTKDIVKLVKAKLSSSVGSFRKSAKYQNQFNIIKKTMSQHEQDNNNNHNHNHTMTTLQLNSGMTMDVGTLDTDREYQLILDCNKLIHDIDDEIAETHRLVYYVCLFLFLFN